MERVEVSSKPPAGLVELKTDLRALVFVPGKRRRKLVAIAAECGLGRTTVGDLLNLKHASLPKESTLRSFVGCYAPARVNEFVERWEAIPVAGSVEPVQRVTEPEPEPARLDSEGHGEETAGDADDSLDVVVVEERPRPVPVLVDGGRDLERTGTGRRKVVIVGVSVSVLIAGVAGGALMIADNGGPASAGNSSPSESTSTDEPPEGVVDGIDPATRCVGDASRVRTELIGPDGQVGFVSLVHSPECGAYWARAERTDGLIEGNHIEVEVHQDDDNDRRQRADEPNADVAYTFLLADSTGSTYCASATIWVDATAHTSDTVCWPER